VIFTLPDTLNVLLARNQAKIYDLVLRTAADTLLHFADQQFHGMPAITAVLHTWGQTLWQHIHAHFIVSGGALRHDGKRWVKGQADFLFDVRKLSAEFRDRFCRRLGRARLDFSGDAAALADPAAFAAFLQAEESRDWVVYCKKPFAGPAEVLEYIGRYTHRVAIANGRILAVGADGTVTIDYKDYHDQDARGAARHKTMTLAAFEFLRRFLLHVLPHGFRKIWFYGLLAGADRRASVVAASLTISSSKGLCPCDPAGKDPGPSRAHPFFFSRVRLPALAAGRRTRERRASTAVPAGRASPRATLHVLGQGLRSVQHGQSESPSDPSAATGLRSA
jgi:hypothetical protein